MANPSKRPSTPAPALLVVALFTATSASSANLLTNPAFTTDLTGWTVISWPDAFVFPFNFGHLAPNSAHPNTFGGTPVVRPLLTQCVSTGAASRFDFGVWFFANWPPDGGASSWVQVEWSANASCSSILRTDTSPPTLSANDVWVPSSASGILAPAGTVAARVTLVEAISVASSSATFWDDAWLTPSTLPGEASGNGSLRVTKSGASQLALSYGPACSASDHAATFGDGPISGSIAWSSTLCSLGTSGAATITPPAAPPSGLQYFVVVGQTPGLEGSYGRDSSNVERPEAIGVGACDRSQDYTAGC